MMIPPAIQAKFARARALMAQAERLRAEAEAELLDMVDPAAVPVVTEDDVTRMRRRLRRAGG